MTDSIEVRYVGPFTELFTLEPATGSVAGQVFEIVPGEWVALPADLVNGTGHTYDLDYEVPEDPADVDSDQIVEHGISGLAEQTYENADGDVVPMWETRGAVTPAPAPTADSSMTDSAAPTTEGLNDGDSLGS